MLKDPVCGMELPDGAQEFASDYKGKKFYFCSYACQSEFEKGPDKYATHFEALRVRDLMADADFVNSGSSALEAAKKMSGKGSGCVLVVENGKAIGIITERDLVARVLVEGALVQQILAKDVMSSPLVAVGPEASVEEASRIMSQYAIRRLPVVSGEAFVGLITSTDIAMQMAKEKQFKDHRLNALAKYCVSPATEPYK